MWFFASGAFGTLVQTLLVSSRPELGATSSSWNSATLYAGTAVGVSVAGTFAHANTGTAVVGGGLAALAGLTTLPLVGRLRPVPAEEAGQADSAPAEPSRKAAAVGLGPEHLHRRPDQLSGGQCQRVAIARALAPSPGILVCDEPVSALDASVREQVMDLLDDLQRRLGTALLFVSHDLSVIRRISDRVLVMKDAEVVEEGSAEEVFDAPRHPYTKSLLAAVLTAGPPRGATRPGTPPAGAARPR
ncbi:ATP-binding cassette domain-containing protein [Streptomyces sp. NPDC058240]|uniref:ATP-binding cassette domain-containing protein n=1 Tax=Streptomyces sp. NPDC058240 TaxID=3346396 RepID=UPI0036F06C7F